MDIEIDLSGIDINDVEVDIGHYEDHMVTIGGLRLRLNNEMFTRLCGEFGQWITSNALRLTRSPRKRPISFSFSSISPGAGTTST